MDNKNKQKTSALDTLFSSSPALFITVFVFAIACFLIFKGLGQVPLISPDESRNASVALEMKLNGHWLVPTYNGLPYLDKPAFFFKLVSFSYHLLGDTPFAARLPSAFFALATLALIFGFCRRVYDIKTAGLAVLIIASTPLFLVLAKYVIFDMTLGFFVTASILAGYSAQTNEGNLRGRWIVLSSLAAGIATLVKGPVGFALPLIVLSSFHLLERQYSALKQLWSWKYFLVLLAVVLPWFIGLSIQEPDFPYYGVMLETVSRLTSNQLHRNAPIYYYLPVVFGFGLFWSLLLPGLIHYFWKTRRKFADIDSADKPRNVGVSCEAFDGQAGVSCEALDDPAKADRLFITWSLTVIAFFSISHSKLPGYILTAMVAIGVLIARLFVKALAQDQAALKVIRLTTLCFAFLYFLSSLAIGLFALKPALLDKLISAFMMLPLPKLHALMLKTALLSLLISALLFLAYHRRKPLFSFSLFLLPILLFELMFIPVCQDALQARSDQALATELKTLSQGKTLAFFACLPPGMPFYLKHKAIFFTATDGQEVRSNYIPYALSKNTAWPNHIKHLNTFDAWASHKSESKTVLLVIDERYTDSIKQIQARYHAKLHLLPWPYYALELNPQDALYVRG